MKTYIQPPEGMCPVQSMGVIDDHPYYFRSRGSHWTLTIALPGKDAILPTDEELAYHKSGYVGPWPAAGWMAPDEAMRIIHECVDEFRAGKRGIYLDDCDECKEKRDAT